LRGLVERTKGKKLPTAKALRESNTEVVASAAVCSESELTVYRNGFFTYSTADGTTVYAVDRCTWFALDGGEALDAGYFEGEEWTVRLMLAGEDRLEHNQNVREDKNRFYSSDDTPDRTSIVIRSTSPWTSRTRMRLTGCLEC
jgi:surface antigen